MKLSSNELDFGIDFSKYVKLSELCDQDSKNPQNLTPLSLEMVESLIEESKKLKDELQNHLDSYKEKSKPLLDKYSQEKKQMNNQKIKKQTLNHPTNQLTMPVAKEKPPQRIQHELTPMYQTTFPKIEKPNKNISTSQSRHHDKKNVSKSTGGEKPTRQSTDNRHKNSVWNKADPFFQDLPDNKEFEKMFSIIDAYAENRKNQIREIQSNEKVQHWNERMNQYVRSKMHRVPPPPPDANDISDYWKNNQISFQIEEMQKRSFSCFHYLINSFVEIDSFSQKKTNSPLSSPNPNEEIDTKESEEIKDKKEPNPIASFSLLPQIVSETYMALSFDQRLSLEIESLELKPKNGLNFKRTSPIEEEINSKMKECNDVISTLSQMRDDIMSNIDDYRRQQQERNRMIELSQSVIIRKSNKQSNK